MEKEQILSEITTRVGKTSLSQRTLTDYVNRNLPTEGTEPDDAFWEKHVGFLKSLDGNYSHDVSTQVEEFKKNYKPNQQQANDTPQEGKDNEVLELLKGIKDENKELRERLDRQDQVKSQSELREKVIAGMKAKGVNDEYVLTTTLTKHGEFDSKKSVDELVDSLLPIYDKEFSACRGNGAVPRTGQQQQQNTKNETLKRFKERHQKAGDLPVAN
ncbi:hypothetical protein [Bacteroides oleiciplenus]|uniref:hypothetical protein n=1 Tax=Bacteroides oleiciplenus TaxID=626931 RepID=UPI0026DB6768|nr:hypothetical protein [Bacteroides oleiciplenus]